MEVKSNNGQLYISTIKTIVDQDAIQRVQINKKPNATWLIAHTINKLHKLAKKPRKWMLNVTLKSCCVVAVETKNKVGRNSKVLVKQLQKHNHLSVST